MIKFAVLLVALATTVNGFEEVEEEWIMFKENYGKKYTSPIEDRLRMYVFQKNLEKIEAHNKDYEAGIVSYKLSITQFADMLEEEFLKLLTYNSVKQSLIKNVSFQIPNDTEVPKAINWVENGAVTPVKNQLACGSCWSFTATGGLEGQYFQKTKQLVSLSEQNLIDCSWTYGNKGCHGGLTNYAFQYVSDHGIEREQDYPYKRGEEDDCHFDPEKSVLKVQSVVDLASGNETQLEEAVATIGPICATVDASFWPLYGGGIFVYAYCKNESYYLNHAVLVVGYDTDENGIDYWLIKNSWGDGWGEGGYIKLAKNRNNECGIATEASYPVISIDP